MKIPDINSVKNFQENNPLGKAYSKEEFISFLPKEVKVIKIFYHFFPLRSLPFGFLKIFHRVLDRYLPFMIFVMVRKIS